MTTLTVSPSGTAALAQLVGKPPENPGKVVSKDTIPTDGSVYVVALGAEQPKPAAVIRPVTPDDLLDVDAQATGRFLDITA
jgi:hypothetical protein